MFLSIVVNDSSAQGGRLPFKLQKNGGISMNDMAKLVRQPPSRERITNEQLEKIKSENPTKYGKEFKATNGKVSPPRGDIYKNSKLLESNGVHTILPERAILHIPDKLKERVTSERKGDLVLWPQFFRDNFRWIQVKEVSLNVAKGDELLPDAVLENIAKSSKIIVAVYRRFPISVLPQKVKEISGDPSEIETKNQ